MMPVDKPVALWAAPRSVSTAFERVFVERGDFTVFHEPFAVAYYFSEERRSDRFPDTEPDERYKHASVWKEIRDSDEKPVFFKDMAYHVTDHMGPEFAARFTNTFIIREPREALTSFYKMWPDFTFEEAGYEQLHRLFGYAEQAEEEPIIVDAADLAEDPEGTVAAYCESLDIPFVPEALTWEPREVPEWKTWESWHTDAQKSTGLSKTPRKKVELPEDLVETCERCQPYYEDLREKRLRPIDPAEVS